jgi:MFS superfamily sulfate permease-like transporter
MTENPYAAPRTDTVGTPANPVRLYSPLQAASGSLLGGPVAVVYFLRANFLALGMPSEARATLVLGIGALLALLVVLPLLPDRLPSSAITIVYFFFSKVTVEQRQMTRQEIVDSPEHDFHSNGRVVALGLACLIASMVVLLVPAVVLGTLGVPPWAGMETETP